MPRSSRCLLLFARAPRAEARRKRLPGTERLFALTAERVATAAAESGFDLLIVGGVATAHGVCAGRLWQRGRSFAERLENAFADAAALGYENVVAVPGDVPGLSAARLLEAARALAQGKVVLGPSPDGGVYLLGLGGAASLLRGVRWQTGAVFSDLLKRAGRDVLVLRPLSDVDGPRDLDRLLRERALEPGLLRLIRELRGRSVSCDSGEDARPSDRFRPTADALRGPPPLA